MNFKIDPSFLLRKAPCFWRKSYLKVVSGGGRSILRVLRYHLISTMHGVPGTWYLYVLSSCLYTSSVFMCIQPSSTAGRTYATPLMHIPLGVMLPHTFSFRWKHTCGMGDQMHADPDCTTPLLSSSHSIPSKWPSPSTITRFSRCRPATAYTQVLRRS